MAAVAVVVDTVARNKEPPMVPSKLLAVAVALAANRKDNKTVVVVDRGRALIISPRSLTIQIPRRRPVITWPALAFLLPAKAGPCTSTTAWVR